jgi:hypothetical protein
MSRLDHLAICAALACVSVPGRACRAQDADHDGVPDALENHLLILYAPEFRTDDADDDGPPLPISWYVSHCVLRTEANDDSCDYNGRSWGWTMLSQIGPPDTARLNVSGLVQAFFSASPATYDCPPNASMPFYRLSFSQYGAGGGNGDIHNGNDPLDPRRWSTAQLRQDCLYGRCTGEALAPYCPSSIAYQLQYFMFFAYNQVDADRNPIGCPYGNHEGDVVCVEYMVEYRSDADRRIISAVYHNHGRQIFVEPSALVINSSGHPVVYLEQEEHEAMPWSGSCGFTPAGDGRPAGVATNHLFATHCFFFGLYCAAAECGEDSVCRTHFGLNSVVFNNVINLGEKGYPYSSPSSEEMFVMNYPGRYGDDAQDGCDIATVFVQGDGDEKVDSPRGPPQQNPMWERQFKNWDNNANWHIYINASQTAFEQTGLADKPFHSFNMGAVNVQRGGIISMQAGSYPETITIDKPMTIQSSGGSVTIGY